MASDSAPREDITREQENAAFDKLRYKLEMVHPSNRWMDPVLMPKMKYSELKAIMQFYLRHSH